MVIWCRLVGCQQSLILLWKCWRLGCLRRVYAMWVGKLSVVFDFVQNVTKEDSLCYQSRYQLPFMTFVERFIAMFAIGIGSEKLWGKVYDWLKKGLFNYALIFTFQTDGCTESTFAATCFIYFPISCGDLGINSKNSQPDIDSSAARYKMYKRVATHKAPRIHPVKIRKKKNNKM